MAAPFALARAAVWNADERRPRSPLRLLAHAVLLATSAVAAVLALQVGLLAAGVPDLLADPGGPFTAAVTFLAVGGAAVAATLLAARFVDRRTLSDVGLGLDRAWWRDLGAGMALGAGLQTGVFALQAAAGWTRVEAVGAGGADLLAALALGAVAMAAVGAYEELLFRGYWLVNLAEGLVALPRVDARRATLAAAAATSVAFGLVHGTNPNATAVSTSFVAMYGGYLAGGYLLTGDLALPVGFHAAWNYAQAFVYGFPVSGLDAGASLLATETAGPELLTGGRFGPEAGLVGLALVAASVPAVLWWVRRTRGTVALRADVAVPDLRFEAGDDQAGTAAREGESSGAES